MSDQGWRTPINAGDYFLHQQKTLDFENRKPVIRRASDLVGPGLDGSATRITDFNDTLALFNGYFSAARGALNAPNLTDTFIIETAADNTLGGKQTATTLSNGSVYTRIFYRNPSDLESITFLAWRLAYDGRFPDTDWIRAILGNGWVTFDANEPKRYVEYKREAGWVKCRGIMRSGPLGPAWVMPAGFRPQTVQPDEQHLPCVANSAFAAMSCRSTDGAVQVLSGSNVWLDVSGLTYRVGQ